MTRLWAYVLLRRFTLSMRVIGSEEVVWTTSWWAGVAALARRR
jgi:hypothetical protein